MQNDSPLIQVEVTAKFKHNLQILAKKYRIIRNNIQPIIKQLQSTPNSLLSTPHFHHSGDEHFRYAQLSFQPFPQQQ